LTVFVRGALLVLLGIIAGLLFSVYVPDRMTIPKLDRAAILRRLSPEVRHYLRRSNARRKLVFLLPGEIKDLKRTLSDSQQQLLTERAFKEQLLKQSHDDKPYLVISLADNILYLKQRDKILRACRVATGRQRSEMIQGHLYHFFTPRTIFEILRKEQDPQWYMPDWAFRERGVEPPPMSERKPVLGALGKYSLQLQGGYLIHGTNNDASLGKYLTHGCIRMGANDLKAVYDFIPVGTKVYIY